MTATSAELRRTSDALLRDLEALTTLEEDKRTLPASDPRLTELASQIHEIAQRVLAGTGAQKELTQELASAPGTDLPIERVRRSPATILAEWRDIEQRRVRAPRGSAARAELEILAQRIRDEYREAFDSTALEGHQLP